MFDSGKMPRSLIQLIACDLPAPLWHRRDATPDQSGCKCQSPRLGPQRSPRSSGRSGGRAARVAAECPHCASCEDDPRLRLDGARLDGMLNYRVLELLPLGAVHAVVIEVERVPDVRKLADEREARLGRLARLRKVGMRGLSVIERAGRSGREHLGHRAVAHDAEPLLNLFL
eukprot:4574126-Prymnesium_polylepis.1